MARNRYSRRTFVGGIGLGAAAWPYLKTGRALAQSARPKKLVIFFTPNGTIPEEFFPVAVGNGFSLGRILEPLEPHKSDINVLSGIDMTSTTVGPGDQHMKGMGHCLTGATLTEGDSQGCAPACTKPAGWASSLSIDQRIANEIGQTTPFRSVELGVDTTSESNIKTRMCYAGRNQPLPPTTSPRRAFDRLFANVTTSMDSGDESQPSAPANNADDELRKARHQSVLDFVREDFSRIQRRVGSEDRARLQLHLDYVRDIERRLEPTSVPTPAPSSPDQTQVLCAKPSRIESSTYMPTAGPQMIQITAAALACDITNVVSIQWDQAVGEQEFAGFVEGTFGKHHDLSHDDNESAVREALIRINNWYAKQYAFLISELKRLGIFEDTTILWINELGLGRSHSYKNIPIVLAGSAGGYFKTGQHLQFNGRHHNDVHISLMQAFGIASNTFGDPNFCTGAINELRA